MQSTALTIGIVGCGWLGLPVGRHWAARGWTVVGSTTRNERLPALEQAGIRPFMWASQQGPEVWQPWTEQLSQLWVMVPPSGWDVAALAALIQHMPRLKRLLLTSSISVYGNPEMTVHENSPLQPDTASAHTLVAAEQWVLQQTQLEGIVLRLGGLLGPNRHPVVHLAGRHGVPQPHAPINLVGLADLIAAFTRLAERPVGHVPHQVYNLVAPRHPSRMTYYTQQARVRGLEAPQFDLNDLRGGKTVDASLFTRDFDFQYQSTDLGL